MLNSVTKMEIERNWRRFEYVLALFFRKHLQRKFCCYEEAIIRELFEKVPVRELASVNQNHKQINK